MEEYTRLHLEYLAIALWFDERSLLDDHLIWCKVLFFNLGLPVERIESTLRSIADTVDASLPAEEAAVVRDYVNASLQVFDAADPATAACVAPGQPLGELAREYLRAALHAEQNRAVSLLSDAVASGTPVRDIYRQVFQPVQHEIGRLWLINEVSVAQEHYITAVTQLSMAHFYDRMFVGEEYGRTVVVACVGNELHELGARMVADFFEMDRWNTHFLGANTPPQAIVEAVSRTKADVVALSTTMSFHVSEVADTIALVREDPTTASAFVLVGGHPFEVAPDLWLRVGADGTALDADAAIRLADELVGPGVPSRR
jgi:methanogenic corrinoid protein MtbC1